jgi:hypothetical protein
MSRPALAACPRRRAYVFRCAGCHKFLVGAIGGADGWEGTSGCLARKTVEPLLGGCFGGGVKGDKARGIAAGR